ncbi:MAG TPA: hypothetical protein VNH11_17030 [Pirellulales bacterium]|nr:hypothetical protein [Pirellulales bacterium]
MARIENLAAPQPAPPGHPTIGQLADSASWPGGLALPGENHLRKTRAVSARLSPQRIGSQPFAAQHGRIETGLCKRRFRLGGPGVAARHRAGPAERIHCQIVKDPVRRLSVVAARLVTNGSGGPPFLSSHLRRTMRFQQPNGRQSG